MLCSALWQKSRGCTKEYMYHSYLARTAPPPLSSVGRTLSASLRSVCSIILHYLSICITEQAERGWESPSNWEWYIFFGLHCCHASSLHIQYCTGRNVFLPAPCCTSRGVVTSTRSTGFAVVTSPRFHMLHRLLCFHSCPPHAEQVALLSLLPAPHALHAPQVALLSLSPVCCHLTNKFSI